MGEPSSDQLDPSKRAVTQLDSVLDDTNVFSSDVVIVNEKLAEKVTERVETETVPIPTPPQEPETPKVLVKKARAEETVLTHETYRSSARLLILTKHTALMDEGSDARRIILDLQARFMEVHIVLLNERSEHSYEGSVRLFENVWVYPTNSLSWWLMSIDAYRVAKKQLVFSGGFRVDLIVADDTCESGMVGMWLGRMFKRPFQLHVGADFFDEGYIATQPHPLIFSWCTAFVLESVQSVRTKTDLQRNAIIATRKALEPHTEVLPRYYDLRSWETQAPTFDLHTRYPQFKFILLHISSMQAASHTIEVLTAVARVLVRYSSIGLVMVGDGPQRETFEHLITGLGLQNQVAFEPAPEEHLSHMKTANAFLHLSDNPNEDDFILMAGIAKVPIIASTHGLSGKLFINNESARLCEPTDISCIAESINYYLNQNQNRVNFAESAHQAIVDRVDQNYETYLDQLAESIERSAVAEE